MAGAAVVINELGELGLEPSLIAIPNEDTGLLASGWNGCTVRNRRLTPR